MLSVLLVLQPQNIMAEDSRGNVKAEAAHHTDCPCENSFQTDGTCRFEPGGAEPEEPTEGGSETSGQEENKPGTGGLKTDIPEPEEPGMNIPEESGPGGKKLEEKGPREDKPEENKPEGNGLEAEDSEKEGPRGEEPEENKLEGNGLEAEDLEKEGPKGEEPEENKPEGNGLKTMDLEEKGSKEDESEEEKQGESGLKTEDSEKKGSKEEEPEENKPGGKGPNAENPEKIGSEKEKPGGKGPNAEGTVGKGQEQNGPERTGAEMKESEKISPEAGGSREDRPEISGGEIKDLETNDAEEHITEGTGTEIKNPEGSQQRKPYVEDPKPGKPGFNVPEPEDTGAEESKMSGSEASETDVPAAEDCGMIDSGTDESGADLPVGELPDSVNAKTDAAEKAEHREEKPLPPVIKIENVQPLSANAGAVAPKVVIENFSGEADKVKLELESFTRGVIEKDVSAEQVDGQLHFLLPELSEDDQYILRIKNAGDDQNLEQSVVFSVNQSGTMFSYDKEKSDICVTEKFTPVIRLQNIDTTEVVACMVNGRETPYVMKEDNITIEQDYLREGKNQITLAVLDMAGNVSVMEPWEFIVRSGPGENTVPEDTTSGGIWKGILMFFEHILPMVMNPVDFL